jgi:hypothetical protein
MKINKVTRNYRDSPFGILFVKQMMSQTLGLGLNRGNLVILLLPLGLVVTFYSLWKTKVEIK